MQRLQGNYSLKKVSIESPMSNDILRSANTTLDQRFVKSVTLLRGRVEIRWPRELIIIC